MLSRQEELLNWELSDFNDAEKVLPLSMRERVWSLGSRVHAVL